MTAPNIESLWVFALASKCKSLNFIFFLVISCLSWSLMTVLYWAHPGGPAWGKHKWRKSNSFSVSSYFGVHKRTIPGPMGVPLLGSMGLMAGLAHQKIAAMAKACGANRLMAFSLGETRVIVTCNPDVAKKILNSSVFADRPIKESAYSLMFCRAIGFAPYGVYWRMLRRIAATHMFSPKQIKASESQRLDIATQMTQIFTRDGKNETAVNVREVLKTASLNNMMRSVFGRKYGHDSNNTETEELRKLVDQGYDLLGALNWSDHLPWLMEFDPQKIRIRCSNLVPKVNRFVSRIIAEHRTHHHLTRGLPQDFVDVLLSLQGCEKLADSDMIAVLWEMIFRGTDTVAVLIEWVLARMVLHPDVQSRVHDELNNIVGMSRAVTEADVAAMVYLPAVVKEVLRLHPPGPLLSWARLATTDTIVDGYRVPAETTAMVNMWAITRDPHVWTDPLVFKPERFVNEGATEGVEFSVMGSDLRLAPFGSGKRTCPGKALGLTTANFWVASLMHDFKWEGSVDLSEVLKLSCEMANPLLAKVQPRRTSSLV